MSALPPAGWYDAPDMPGSLRWWDGASWTDHRNSPTAAVGVPYMPGAAAFHEGDLVPAELGAMRVGEGDAPHIRSILDELAGTVGIRVPSLWLLTDDVPNAFATGYEPDAGAVTVTTGLLETVDRSGLRAVLAHEVGHVALGHIARNTQLATQLANGATLATAATAIVGGVIASATEGIGDDILAGFATAAMAQSQAQSAVRKLREDQRRTELEADDFAAVIGGDHSALGRTLAILDAHVAALPTGAMSSWLRLLCIVEPHDDLATHPPTAVRAHHARRWGVTAVASDWECRWCAFAEEPASLACRRCGRPRDGASLSPTIGHPPGATCPPVPADARYCPWCGSSVSSTIDLGAAIQRRLPTPLGLRPHRSSTQSAPLAVPSGETIRSIAKRDLGRGERMSQGAILSRAEDLLPDDEMPLGLSSAAFTTGLGDQLSGLVVVAPSGLLAVGRDWSEWIGFAEIQSQSDAAGGSRQLRIGGLPLDLQLTGGGAATAGGLLRMAEHRRTNQRARAIW